MNSLYITRIVLTLGLLISFYSLPTPSKMYDDYSYHCIKNACLALIQDNGDAREAVRYVNRLDSAVANQVMKDLIVEGKVPKKYGYGNKN